MANNEDKIFQLITDFQTWKDGDALNEQRLVQHELVLAHLARLYGSLNWNAQNFGLCPPHNFHIDDLKQEKPKISKLVAITSTGKLMFCNEAVLPKIDKSNAELGLFALAIPYSLPEPLSENLPDFPLYQVKLEWRAWQQGIEEIVKTGDGIPIGRIKDGQWDERYIPPVLEAQDFKSLEQKLVETESGWKGSEKNLTSAVKSQKEALSALEKRLAKASYVSVGWYVLSMLGLVGVAVLVIAVLINQHDKTIKEIVTTLETYENVRTIVTKNQADNYCPEGSKAAHVPLSYRRKTGNDICAANRREERTCQSVAFVYVTNANGVGRYSRDDKPCGNPVGFPWPWGTFTERPSTLPTEWHFGSTNVVCCRR